MCRNGLFSLNHLRGTLHVWWRLPLAVLLVVAVASVQHVVVIGIDRLTPAYLVVPTLVGLLFGSLWSVLAAYRHRLQQVIELMRHLAEDASDVLILRCQEGFLFLSPRIRDLTGYDAEVFELTPTFFEQLIHEEDRGCWTRYQTELWEGETGVVRSLSFRLVTTLHGIVWVQHEASCFDFGGRRLCRCVLRNVSDEMQLKDALQRLSEEDRLTHLPNRSVLLERCMALETPVQLTCVMADVVRLRHINVRFGIEVGDFVLQTVAERLARLRERADAPELLLVSRVVGDNFVLLFKAPRSQVEAWLSEHLPSLVKPVFSEKLRLFIEVDVALGYHEVRLEATPSHHQLEQMLRKVYLQVHAVEES